MMQCPAALTSCAGSVRLPSFHAAEILSLHLRRTGQSVLRLHGWINTGAVGQDGYFVLDRHAIVTFTLSGVMELQLVGVGTNEESRARSVLAQ